LTLFSGRTPTELERSNDSFRLWAKKSRRAERGRDLHKAGAGALAVLALIAAFGLVTGISELVVAIGGEKLLERKAKTFAPPRRSPKTTPEPSH
jgi:hypothetical protein